MSARRSAAVFVVLIVCVAAVFAITVDNWSLTEETVLAIKEQNDLEHRRIDAIYQSMRVGPRHTACDTRQILDDLRAAGVAIKPRYEVEDRCAQ